MYSTHSLETIAALAQHRHFGRAAKALGISQPALTKSLKAIERQIGATLFDRGPPITPTPIGDLILARGEAILAEFAALKREIDLARGLDTGRLVVAVGGHVADFTAIDAVAALSRAHPFIGCDLQVSDHLTVMRDVREGCADVGIAAFLPAERHDDLSFEPLRNAPYILFCAPDHPLAAKNDVAPAELLEYPWVSPSATVPPFPGYDGIRRPFGDVDLTAGTVTMRLRSNSLAATVRIVMRSQALSAAPVALVSDHIAAGRLRALRAPYGWPDLNYGFILRRGRTPSPAANAYMAEVRRLETALG